MPVATYYTVPATDIYTDSVTGARHKFFEGAVIRIEQAVRFSMPGASITADGSPFSPAEDAWLDATLEGEGDFATSDHTHTGVYATSSHTHAQEPQARTATATGATTGTISDPASGNVFVPVTSDDANKIIILPTPTPGTVVALSNGATGYELRSSTPGSVAINGGTGANAESAIAADTLVVCVCRTATAWLCSNTNTAGVVSATEVAAA